MTGRITDTNAVGHPVLFAHGDLDAARRCNARAYAWYVRSRRMPLWVVYRPITREYPGLWVVRLWVCHPNARPTRRVGLGRTLGDVRAYVPAGLCRCERLAGDVPEIEEMWL